MFKYTIVDIMSDYKNKLGDLANQLKKEKSKSPIQEVKLVKQAKEETQFNLWIPTHMYKSIKRLAFEREESIKDTVIAAIDNYLSNNKV